MSSIERQITVTRGPFFFEQDGELMFQFVCDNSTIVGPLPARSSHIDEYPEALATFKALKAQGIAVEPEFVTREAPAREATRGLSAFDLANGVRDSESPSGALNVGAGGRKAAPAMDPVAEKAAIRAELEALGAEQPHHLAGLAKLREALAVAKGG